MSTRSLPTTPPPNDTPPDDARIIDLRAADIRALISAAVARPDPWLSMAELEATGWSRESLRSAAEKGLPVYRGPRGKIQVRQSDIDAWITSRPWRPVRSARPAASDLDEWQAEADAELEAMAKGGAA